MNSFLAAQHLTATKYLSVCFNDYQQCGWALFYSKGDYKAGWKTDPA